ncbi:hypothetical protein WJX72_005609 [[Myrmecia] bisecta]|uniref:STAS domain-containing protein n=1 Tax=[Myrmecia] bisecta TaxID=41462 RepID=A0AAW1Q150_9CHLO
MSHLPDFESLPILPRTHAHTTHLQQPTDAPPPARCKQQLSAARLLQTALPCLQWLKDYDWRACLRDDLLAGATVGVMVVPQSVSFAAMARLPSSFGLYTSLAPIFAYAIWGSSRQLAVGPVALVSLLLSEGLHHIVPAADAITNPNLPEDPAAQRAYNHAAIQVSLLVAVIYLLLGAARLGFLTDLLSRPIISSFLTAGAVIISLSQVKYLVGYEIPHENRVHLMLYHLAKGLHSLRWAELLMGLCWITTLFAIKRLAARSKRLSWLGAMGPITVTLLSISSVWLGHLHERAGIRVVGKMVGGLPPVTVGWWAPVHSLPRMLVTAASISMVSLLEAISIARAIAFKHGDTISPTQELFGLGFANLAGAAFGGYPSTGSFARSFVAENAGAKSGIAAVVAACIVGLTLLFLTPVFQLMPMNALAAIVIAGVLGLIDPGKAVSLFRVSKADFAVWLVCCLVALFVGVDWGLACGVGTALLILLYRTAFPDVAVLEQVPHSHAFRPCEWDSEVHGLKGLLILRVSGPICFANAEYIKERLAWHEVHASDMHSVPIRCVVLDLSAVSHMDTSGLDAMRDWRLEFGTRGMHLQLASPNSHVSPLLRRSGLWDAIGQEHVHAHLHEAVECARHLLGRAASTDFEQG